MSNEDSKAIYFISVASTLSGIHQQTIRTYEMKDKIEELQDKILMLENEISNQKIDSKNKEKEIHQSYKNEIVNKSDKSISK